MQRAPTGHTIIHASSRDIVHLNRLQPFFLHKPQELFTYTTRQCISTKRINQQRQKDTYKTADNKADQESKHTSIEPPLYLPSTGHYTAHSVINFVYSCLQPAFLFLLAAFCSLFHDIVSHACKIQQKGAKYKAIIQTKS